MEDGRSIQRALESEKITPEDALAPLVKAAHDAATSALRLDACRVLGAIAGRAFGASWEIAERAAFALLDVSLETDLPQEKVGLLSAMGRAFRNIWFLPYVHRRFSDEDDDVVAAAISAAGGLAFPALEETIAAGFLGEGSRRRVRLAAIAALGRMGAESAAARLAPFVLRDPAEAAAALAALTEIRSRAGEEAALEVLSHDPPRNVLLGAVRYLAEMGRPEVQSPLRRLARDDDPELRIAGGVASRAFDAERKRDADERILAALTERDRAVRASLARRLRTLPAADVLEQAELLLRDDPLGVVQIVAEVRSPDVTRLLLRLAADTSVEVAVRARAAGSIEADEPWERDALVDLVKTSKDVPVCVAAAQTIGAFAAPAYVLEHLAPLATSAEPKLRAALLWAIQLATRPVGFSGSDRARAEAIVRDALADADGTVRKRAAYVAGNLDAAALVPDLVELVRREGDRDDLRLAAFVALGEIASPARFADLVHLWNKEDDPEVLGAASRAIERAVVPPAEPAPPSMAAPGSTRPSTPPRSGPVSAPPSLARAHDRLKKLLSSPDPKVRTAALRVAGLTPGSVPLDLVASLVDDQPPRVREQAVAALGRLATPACEPALSRALHDADPAIQERAAHALVTLGSAPAVIHVLDFVSRTHDRAAALRITTGIVRPREEAPSGDGPSPFLEALDAALHRVGPDHPIYEPLLELKLDALEASRPAPTSLRSVEASITALFPTWTKLSAVRNFEPLAKSLRTGEMLFSSSAEGSDASAPIVLWMKCLEGYLHAWLGPRLSSLQEKPSALWDLVDRVTGTQWPTYQRWLGERWPDPVKVGELSVEVPLRSVVNALREHQERRLKSIDSPISVTEWSRLMLFYAVDHASGAKNLLKVVSRDADRTVRLAHRLHVLAQVRNSVTHRSVASAATLSDFRTRYYTAFEELTQMA